MKNWIKNIAKIIAVAIGLLLLLLLILRLPFVQTFIVNKISNGLSEKLETKVSIDRVNINFIDHLAIEGIYLEDQSTDTLLYADFLEVDIAIFSLLFKEINIENIVLNQSKIRINQLPDSSFNFSFILDAFASEDTTNKAFPFSIQLGKLEITKADYSLDLLQSENRLRLQRLILSSNEIDINLLVFRLASIELEGLNLESYWPTGNFKIAVDETQTLDVIQFPLSGLPITVVCDEIRILQTKGRYQKGNATIQEYFDPNIIVLDDINITIQNLFLSDTLLRFNIEESSLCLNKNKELNHFNAAGQLGETEISLNSKPWTFNQSKFDFNLQGSYEKFDDLVKLKSNVNAQIISEDLQLAVADLLYFLPNLDSIVGFHNMRNERVFLMANLRGQLNALNISQLSVHTLNTKLELVGMIKNIPNWKQVQAENAKLNIDAKVEDLRMFLGENIIPMAYNRFGMIKLNSKFNGGIDLLAIDDLNVMTSGDLSMKLAGTLEQLDLIEQLSYNLKVTQLKSSYNDARVFTKELPEMLKVVDFISYQGLVKGTLHDFNVDGRISSSIGDIDADAFLAFNQDYSNAAYKGQIALQEFQLGELLDNDSLGKLSLTADIDGQGLSLETINADLDVHVSEFAFNSYIYNDLDAIGHIDKKEFEGNIHIDDENLAFDFLGLVDFQDSLPQFNFKVSLDRLNTQAVHLTSYPLEVSLEIDAELAGKTLDDMEGDVRIKTIQLQNTSNNWKTDSIVFKAINQIGGQREIQLISDILNLSMKGNYSIANLGKMFIAFGDQHFPFSALIGSAESGEVYPDSTMRSLQNENLQIEAAVYDLPRLAAFFNIDLKRLDSASLVLNFDAPSQLLDFTFFVPSITYQNIRIDSIYLTADTKSGDLNGKFSIDSASYGDFAYVPGLAIIAEFRDKIANVRTYIENDTGSYSLDLNTELYAENEAIGIRMVDPLMLNTRIWEIDQSSSLILGDSGIILPMVKISNGNQELSFASSPKDYKLNFTNFDLNNLLELVEIDSILAKGRLDGFVKINSESKATAIEADLILKKFTLNNAEIGDMKIEAHLNGNLVESKLSLQGTENSLEANLNYDIDQTDINGQLNIQKLYLPSYEPFFRNYISNVEGFLFGKLNFSGKTDAPTFNGKLNFQGVKAFVKETGTSYGIAQGYVELDEKSIRPKLTFVDQENRQASLSGAIEHNLFRDIKFNMNLSSDGFTFLNSVKDAEALFYGKFIASTQLTIEGNLAIPKVRGKLSTLPESDITVQLLSTKAIATQESYVIFLNGADYSLEEIDSIGNERYQIKTAIDMSILIDVNDKTTLNLVIDPITGDKLAIQGNGQLTLKIPPKGDVDVTGVYTVSSGQYNFSFQNLLKRKFEIVKGSQLVFSGNPMNARLDIKAAYNTEASTYPLIEGQASSLSQEEESEVKKKQDVSVELNIVGKLVEPELSFDINLANSGNSPIGSSASRALDQLKQNETELNKQVFSLLLFNSFSGTSSSGNISSTGSSTAVRSVGNLISSQLNRLASKADGLQIDFDLDQYQDQLSETNEQITEIDLGISQSLFDDRLVISVGGNVDLESGNQSKSSLGNLAGDFIIEYKLSKDGKYKVRVFQKSDFDALNDANFWKTGAGFSYQTKFGKLRKKKGGKP